MSDLELVGGDELDESNSGKKSSIVSTHFCDAFSGDWVFCFGRVSARWRQCVWNDTPYSVLVTFPCTLHPVTVQVRVQLLSQSHQRTRVGSRFKLR